MDETKILKLINYFENKKGISVDALVEALKSFEEQYYYPMQLQDKRIAMQSNFKALCEFYATASLNKEISADDIWKEAKQKTEEMFKDDFFKETRPEDVKGKKYKDMTPEEQAIVDERNRKVNLINEIVANRSEEWLKKVYEASKSKKRTKRHQDNKQNEKEKAKNNKEEKQEGDIDTGKKYKDMTPEEQAIVDERNRKVNLINEIVANRSEEWLKKVYEKSKKEQSN